MTDKFVTGRYKRLGGVGIVRTLYECNNCGCAVSDREQHDHWHRRSGSRPHERIR